MGKKVWLYFCLLLCFSSKAQTSKIVLGAARTEVYLPLLANKRVACVVNQSSLVGSGVHLIDTLLARGINIRKIFAPEHGFRGLASAGEKIIDGIDERTHLPIVSLYGDNKMPTDAQMRDIDIVIFDIQDVGVRFYTYAGTLHYVMQACAKHNTPLVLLDRPNPNGDYIDGPVLDLAFKSFVGMHPIPVVHALTLGELAKMINGEKWLDGGVECNLQIVEMLEYTHDDAYSLPVRPSPNLPNDVSVRLYPSLCLFEGTYISLGRGTDFPFQVAGALGTQFGNFTFTPIARPEAKKPPFENKLCNGLDLRQTSLHKKFTLEYLLYFYARSSDKDKFFNNFFNKLAGNATLQAQIKSGAKEKSIRKSWQQDLDKFKLTRKKYILYAD